MTDQFRLRTVLGDKSASEAAVAGRPDSRKPMVDRDSPEVSVVAAAPSAHGANRYGLETHTPFRMIVRPASSFSSLLAWMPILPTWGLSGYRCKWRLHCYRSSGSGMRSAKVMANAFRAGFHLIAHRD